MKEWPLVAFTLLAQTAVGLVWLLSGFSLWATVRIGAATGEQLTWPGWLAVGPVMLLALLASFRHLGTPLNGWRAFANWRTSWLSREVLCAVLFTGATLLYAGMHGFAAGGPAARHVTAGVAGLLGLALLVSMIKAYRLRTIPAWNSWVTPVSFSLTTLLLGGLAAGGTMALAAGADAEPIRGIWQGIALLVLILLVLQIAVVRRWIAQLKAGPEAAVAAAARLTQQHGRLLRLRLLLAMVGIVIAGGIVCFPASGVITAIQVLLVGVVLTGEVLGRRLFYEAKVRHGV